MEARRSALAAVLLALWTCAAWGLEPPQDSEAVAITVQDLDLLWAPDSTCLGMLTDECGDAVYGESWMTQVNGTGLKYSHNSSTPRRITVEATAGLGNPANDMDMTLTIGDRPAVTLIADGASTGARDAWVDIAAGAYNESVHWTACGSVAGTLAGDYSWAITFTSVAN